MRWQGDLQASPSPSTVSPLCPALPVRARPREEPGVSGQGSRDHVCQHRLCGEGRLVAVRRALAQGGGGRAEPRRLPAPRLRLHLLQAPGAAAGASHRGQRLPGLGCRTRDPDPGESPWGCGRGVRCRVWSSSCCPFPLQFDLQQAHIYCDAELARQEGCCEISASGVSALRPASPGGSSSPGPWHRPQRGN